MSGTSGSDPRPCVDSSIAVAGFGAWHEHHEIAREAIARASSISAHAALETYAVLTRLPDPFRAEPSLVAEYLDRNFPNECLTLPASEQSRLPGAMADAGVSGGAVYDGVVAITAKCAEVTLLSLDRRAARTYERLGVEHNLL